MGKIILTGDRPTGRLHVGHYVGSLRNRVILQNSGKFEKLFFMIADAQALTDNFDNPGKVRENILQVALDYMACGLDPAKCHMFIQSVVCELTELTFYYMNLVTLARLERNPTVKAEIQLRGFNHSIPMGFLTYPVSQTADITAFMADTVPVGEDQLPMIEQAREIVRRFNELYGETLVEPAALLPDNAACLRLPGTDGKAKMSKSLGNCIYLADEPEDIRTKVMGMFTDPNHLQVSDPGQTEGNPVFMYLDAFCRDEFFARYLPDYANLDELKAHYQRGGLGDVKVKKFLNNVLQETLEPIRTRRKELEKDPGYVMDVLRQGTEVAQAAAAETLAEGINIVEKKPTPPDTVFSKALGGWYDIVVVMYHDQGHIPLKVKGFVYNKAEGHWDAVAGVNVTLGLPIIRASVDHGTGFGHAGDGHANELSLVNAMDYGIRMANAKAQK